MHTKKDIKYPEEVLKEMLSFFRNGAKKNNEYDYFYYVMAKLALRVATDFENPRFVSEKAKIEADKLNINLLEKRWKDQHNFDKGRKKFLLEHPNTISSLAKKVIETEDKIEDIANQNFTIWITKEEDQILTKNGYRSDRKSGWEKCYKDCDIIIEK